MPKVKNITDKPVQVEPKRSPPYSNSEKLLLLEVISDFSHIIECPKTDGTSLQAKSDAWKSIVEVYAANARQNGITISRTKTQLKKCWDNLK